MDIIAAKMIFSSVLIAGARGATKRTTELCFRGSKKEGESRTTSDLGITDGPPFFWYVDLDIHDHCILSTL